jgi:23S rRNA (guanosine2251-2'-O)-methyltransferase
MAKREDNSGRPGDQGARAKPMRGRAGRMQGGRGSGRGTAGAVRLWGRHAVEAALTNPLRSAKKLWGTREAIQALLDDNDAELPPSLPVEYAQALDLARLVARDAPHQGLVLDCLALDDVVLGDAIEEAEGRTLVILDSVTDPHNVGAILRSAAAFGAAAIVTQDRHAPTDGGVLAKAASGALETVPWVRVVNLARALEEIAEAGYWRIGLTGHAAVTLDQALTPGRNALVLGAEGDAAGRGEAREVSQPHDVACDRAARD